MDPIVMDDLLREFLTETGEHLDTVDSELVRFERDPNDGGTLGKVFRLVHTIKGTCGFLGLPRLEALAHAAESLIGSLRDGATVTSEAVTLILAAVDRIKLILAELDRVAAEPDGSDGDLIAALERVAAGATTAGAPRDAATTEREPAPAPAFAPAPPAAPDPAPPVAAERRVSERRADERQSARPGSVRVAVDRLEHLITTVSELVLTRNQLLDLARRSGEHDAFKVPLQRLSQVTAELQDGIMKTRMQPIGSIWAKLPRLVRDLAPELGKSFDLRLVGAETELDRQLLETIRDPLTHLIRNAADHGIESPDERVRRGKSPKGTIRLEAFHEGGSITIEVADDGRGIDHDAIRRRAAEIGIAPEAELARMGDAQVAGLMFHPGFSTALRISTVSGRGIGLDVVRSNIETIGGTIEIRSERGRGATFAIKIPLTLAIVATLIVALGDQRFALPQVAVMELVAVRAGTNHALERMGAAALLRLRHELLPVVDLGDLLRLQRSSASPDDGFVVVLQVGRQRFGLLVDGVLETEEIVVKPMSSRLRHLGIFAGNTIMGDGAVVLIMDPNGIARAVGAEKLAETVTADAPQADDDGPDRITLLVFRGADQVLKALPLSLVTRLEEVDAAAIEPVGGRPCLAYRGRLMPIVEIAGSVRTAGTQPLVVVTHGDRHLGLAVREILDVVDEAIEITPVPGRSDLVGSAIVHGRATEIVDLASFLPPATPARRGPESVLLVDDNAFFRDMIAPVLKAAGYRVRTAASAGEALQLVAAGRIGTIVTDYDLPDRNGLDLVAEIRRGAPARNATAILLTSAATPAIIDRARALDVFDIVSKFDRSGLLAALAETGATLGAAA